MITNKCILVSLFFVLIHSLFLNITIQALESSGKRRFALIMGNNYGGINNEPLKYTGRDAMSFSHLLNEIGGVKEKDRIVLLNPSVGDLKSGFKELTAKLQDTPYRDMSFETIIYYSGHSNSKGLQLYNNIYPYNKLKEDIDKLPSKVKIVILDSCMSGAFTRIKGAEMYPPFLTDTSNVAEGDAYLTSCRDTEVAHESDKIKASVFTHTLLIGLRGAADDNNDGNITLNEIYQYAFNNTIIYTQKEAAYPQHPAYKLSLSGTGNIILTNIRTNTARLVIGENMKGNCFIKDKMDNLIIEIPKDTGKSLELSLPPGEYQIFISNDSRTYKKTYKLKKFTTIKILSLNEMDKLPGGNLPVKGRSEGIPFLSTDVSAGLIIPEAQIGHWLNKGIMPLCSIKCNWQYSSHIISLGMVSGLNYQPSLKELSSPYNLFTIPLLLSTRLTTKLFLLYPYLELNGGLALNIQQYQSDNQVVALRPAIDGAVGFFFSIDKGITPGVFFRTTAVFFTDYVNIGFTPGVQINIMHE